MKMTGTLIALLVFAAIILVMSACRIEPVCGNKIHEQGETSENCCLDAGCAEGQSCVNNTCTAPECGECQYFDEEAGQCTDYECCSDDDCKDDEKCSDNECKELTCGDEQIIEGHKCEDIECSSNSDCDDDDDSTIDTCKSPGTELSRCEHENIDTCIQDSDCDDDDDSTEDICVDGNPNECIHISINDCEDGDNYCPEGCSYSEDDDCESEVEDCETSVSCFKDALENCDLAYVNFKMDLDNDTHKMDVVIHLEILGEDDDENCEVHFEFDNIEVDFTSSFVDDLEAENYTEDDIDNLLDDANDDMDDWEGEDGECAFQDDEIEDVKSILDDWRNDDFDPKNDMDSYDCSGNFFDWEWD